MNDSESVPNNEDIFRLQELLTAHRTTLFLLLVQKAKHGSADVPLATEHNILAARNGIREAKQSLQHLGVAVTGLPSDEAGDEAVEDTELPRQNSDAEIKPLRIAAYVDLWKLLKPLAKYDREQPVDRAMLKSVTEAMRDWYFDHGGLFLTAASRIPYFELKEAIRQIVEDPRQANPQLTTAELGRILALASALRSSLAHDIGAR